MKIGLRQVRGQALHTRLRSLRLTTRDVVCVGQGVLELGDLVDLLPRPASLPVFIRLGEAASTGDARHRLTPEMLALFVEAARRQDDVLFVHSFEDRGRQLIINTYA